MWEDAAGGVLDRPTSSGGGDSSGGGEAHGVGTDAMRTSERSSVHAGTHGGAVALRQRR